MADAAIPSRRNLHTMERVVMEEDFRRLPGINADIGVAYNLDWELLGTNAVSADLAFNAGGGFDLATHGGATDSAILLPHLDTKQSAFTGMTFTPAQAPQHIATIKTDTALTNTTIWCGFKLTNTPTVATDDDQCFFKFVAGTDTNWQCIYSIAGTDTTTDSGVAVAASTTYRLWITMTTAGVATFWINGNAVVTTTALTAAAALKPYIGVLSASTATAKKVIVRAVELSIVRS